MMTTPSVSRPPAPVVDPVELNGIRYIEDECNSAAGDQLGGYLAAIEIKSGTRLWRLKVYEVKSGRTPGTPAPMGRYFRAMHLSSDGLALEIVNEAGGEYRVNLATRQVEQTGGPPETAPVSPPVSAKPKPPAPR